jgi:hypothetical protein
LFTGLVASCLGILWRPGLTGTGRFPSAGVALGVAAGVIAAIRPARGGPATRAAGDRR